MSGERTEKPTAKRRKKLRRENVVARSAEFSSAAGGLMLVIAAPMAMHRLYNAYAADLPAMLSQSGQLGVSGAGAFAHVMLVDGARALAVPALLMLGAGLVASVAVSRNAPNMAPLRPRMSNVSPKHGIKRIASSQGLVDMAKSMAKLLIVAAIGWLSWRAGTAHVSDAAVRSGAVAAQTTAAAKSLLLRVAATVLVVGLADALWSRRRYLSRARMTKQEVRDEHKQDELSAEVRNAIRRRRIALVRSRMMAAVKDADVVVANPTHFAVALSYTPGTGAPVVVAKGVDLVALRIRDEAAQHGVPVREHRALARALHAAVDIGESIPPELFRAVAEVLAAVYAARTSRGLPAQRPRSAPPRRPGPSRPTRRARPRRQPTRSQS
ncbi:MAG TPA: EscU/YscU/HrcU family type III secretion system export apparatus switch protein [Mycobacteriales bacterium]|nr:EscU/YscU/HrcU family type III secretion system export apparatus switch protein [Mycobacteriales bacterium]